MPTHKIANDFIKKYNKDLQIKGYSSLQIKQKLELIENKLNSLNLQNVENLKNEWNGITSTYKTKIKSNEEKREKQKKGDNKKKDTKSKTTSLKDFKDTTKPKKKQSDITNFFTMKVEPKRGQSKLSDFTKKPINRSSLKIVPVKTLEKEIKQEKQKEGDNEKKNTKKVSVDRRTRNGLEREFKNTYKKTIYRALNIPNKSNPSPDELKKLCRKLQLKNHPDKQGGSKERIQEINDACKIIDITYKKK